MSKANILIVEDEGIIALDIRERLTSLGYNPLDPISTGEEAIKIVEKENPDLVLMDIMLKGDMDGIEAAEHIQSRFNVPVAFVSAYADEEILEKAKALGPFGYLLKPFEERDLQVTIEVALYKHHIEQKLKESEEHFRLAFENAADAIFWIDTTNGIITNCNKTAETLLEKNNDEIVGYHHKTLHPKELQNSSENNFSKFVNTGEAQNYESEIISSTGKIIPVLIRPSVTSIDGNPIAQSIFRDISERKQIEKSQLELDTRRREYLEIIAHELKSPLTIIKGFGEILLDREKVLTKEQRQQSLEFLQKNISKLETLLTDISELSRLERGVFELSQERVVFGEYLNNEVQSYKILLKDQFEFFGYEDTPDSPILVDIDGERIHQVLANIFDNAIKNTASSDRKIKMITRIAKKSQEIKIEILDNGAGIEPKNLDYIFEPFVTLETKYSAKGTGIGLGLCKEILERHGGSIVAKSEGLNKGSTFIISLPIIKN